MSLNYNRHTTKPAGGWIYTDEIVRKYCVGKGVEVGPSDHPVQGVDTVLVDNKADFAGKQYTVDYIMEADHLHLFRDNQFDFLIAIHMLEHFPNPIKALKEWYRVVRDGGILFIVVPQKGCMFDKYRSTTSLSHLIEDYEKNRDNSDPTHIDEWCTYAIPAVETELGNSVDKNQIEVYRNTLKLQVKDGVPIDIHYHTWEQVGDMMQLMNYLGWEVVQIVDRYTIGKPVGEGNGILSIVRVHKPLLPKAKTRVLLLSDSVISSRMASAGVRFYEIARRLSEACEVTLVVLGETDLKPGKFNLIRCEPKDGKTLKNHVDACDVVILQRQILDIFPSVADMEKVFVIDLSAPTVLENLEKHRKEWGNQGAKVQIHQEILSRINQQLRMGDYFICAHEAQRNFWLGMLCSQNRINPYTYDGDPSLRSLIDIVPYGIPEEKPVHFQQVLKGVYPGIKPADKVLIWGGSLVEWMDPITLMKAMVLIIRQRDDIKLFFMGTERPDRMQEHLFSVGADHPHEIQEKVLAETMDMAKIFSLYNRFVFFNTWVPYEDRQNYLLEADIGVSIHLAGLETQFSSRNRVLDYIWAGLPVLTTKGDFLSNLVERYRLGLSVEPGDAEALAAAILKLVDDKAFRQECIQNIHNISHQFTWENSVKPLVEFCKDPRKKPDEASKVSKASKVPKVPKMPGVSKVPADKIYRILGLLANLKTSLRRRRLKLLEYPSCQIQGRNQVGQSFIAEYSNLYRIDIKFATYLKQSNRNLTFHLKKMGTSRANSLDEEEIISISINASQIRDSLFYPFVFPRQVDSQGKPYYFYLESPDPVRGNSVSVWCTEKYSPPEFGCQPIACYERGWKSKGQVMFRAYYM